MDEIKRAVWRCLEICIALRQYVMTPSKSRINTFSDSLNVVNSFCSSF